MASITLGGTSYFSYISIADADAYLAAEQSAASWRALTDQDDKARTLISASRLLDRQIWAGTLTDADQTEAWPRTDIAGVEDDETPLVIGYAAALLASAMIDGFSATTNPVALPEKRIKADTVEIENFRPNEETAIPLPFAVWQLISKYLGGISSLLGGSESTGTSGAAPFAAGWGLNGPF